MYKQKIIAHNLKASKEQLIDDLNGVMTPLQRRMMKELLSHLDELNVHGSLSIVGVGFVKIPPQFYEKGPFYV
ncbi:hypothetical protein HMPREF9474_04688 [ [[Clostridium] symbiosum WAL-14163]|nr:hypothetical protein HMPREF9474_04688 [ [[Clostridium] symbiosum WAL-14163]